MRNMNLDFFMENYCVPALFSNLVEFLFGGSKILVDDGDNVFDVRAILN